MIADFDGFGRWVIAGACTNPKPKKGSEETCRELSFEAYLEPNFTLTGPALGAEIATVGGFLWHSIVF